MKKLSKAQQEVVAMMENGWELGVSTSFDGRSWLQKGGCGKGGETKTVSIRTFSALRDAGLIESSGRSFPTEKYRLRSNSGINRSREAASG